MRPEEEERAATKRQTCSKTAFALQLLTTKELGASTTAGTGRYWVVLLERVGRNKQRTGAARPPLRSIPSYS